MSAIETKPPVDTGDSHSGGTAPPPSPFDDVLREAFGRPSSTGGNDDGAGRLTKDGKGTDVLSGGTVRSGAGTDNSQPGGVAGADAVEPQEQYLDMETGQIVGGTNQATGSDTGTGISGQESAKSKNTEDPNADAAGPTEPSKKTATPSKEAATEDDPDFAFLNKDKPEDKKDKPEDDDEEDFKALKKPFPSKPADTEKAPGGEKPAVDGKEKPKPDAVEKPKADETKKTPELPNFKPEQNRNRRHETSMEKMTGWLNKNFDVLDADKNGTITRDELGKQMENPALANGEGGVYLATAYGAADTWKNVANELTGKKSEVKESEPKAKDKEKGETNDPNVGITRDGIKAVRDNLEKLDSKEFKEKHAIKSLSDDFPNLDTNKDKTITMAELDSALKDESLGKEQREKLETLKRNFKNVAGTTDDVIKKHYDSGQDAPPEIQKPTLDGKPLKGVEFISEHDLSSFKGSDAVSLQKSLESHTKHLNSDLPVSQGQTGSCFVLAPVGAILEKDPTFFDDKIKDMGNGKLQVSLPDNDGRYGTVNTVISKPTDAERARFGGGETAAIIEKALSQHLKDLYESKKPGAVQDQVHNGGQEHSAIRSLTGNTSKRTSPQEPEEKVLAELSLAGDSTKGLTAGTNPEVPAGLGLMPKHVYHVSGFDKKTGEVELTNPHKGDFGGEIEPMKLGGNARDGKLDGKFKISLAQFKEHFAEINSFDIRKK